MTTQFPPLPQGNTPPIQANQFDMQGAGEVARVLQARDARLKRRKMDPKPETMSVLTQAALEAGRFAKEMREEIRAVTPAPFMKAATNRRLARDRFANLSPEEHVLLARKWGVRTYAKVAEALGFKGDIPIGGRDAGR